MDGFLKVQTYSNLETVNVLKTKILPARDNPLGFQALITSLKGFKLQLHDAIYRLRFYSNSLIHILSLSNSHNNVASIQKNRGDKSHSVIVALDYLESLTSQQDPRHSYYKYQGTDSFTCSVNPIYN